MKGEGIVNLQSIVMTVMVIVSILLILVVAIQPAKTNAASALTSGAEELFSGKQKARGFEAFLIRLTTVLGILFIGLAALLAYLSSK